MATECTVHPNYKAKIIKAKDIDTVTTGQITGHPVRVLKNKLSRQFDAVEKEEGGKPKPDMERIEELGRGALQKAVKEGDMDYGSVMSGQIAGMVTKEQTSKEIIDEIMAGFTALVKEY